MKNSEKKILYFDDVVPQISNGAGFPRAVSIINTLVANGFSVTIYPMQPTTMSFAEFYNDISEQVEVIADNGPDFVNDFLKSRINYYDIVFVSRYNNMRAIRSNLFNLGYVGRVKIIYDAEAICALRDIIYQEKILGIPLLNEDKQKLIFDELNLASVSNAILTVNQYEKEQFLNHGYKNVFVLGHKVKKDLTKNDFKNRKNILFVGRLDHDTSPNVDSILWFVQNVFPQVIAELQDAKLICIGLITDAIKNKIYDASPQNLRDSITILGKIDHTDDYYNDAKVFICPTRFSAGIPFKCHEAASKGLPIVSTELIAQQLTWQNGKDLLCANIPHEFANHIVLLYTDETLWNTLRANACQKIMDEQSPEDFDKTLLNALEVNTNHL